MSMLFSLLLLLLVVQFQFSARIAVSCRTCACVHILHITDFLHLSHVVLFLFSFDFILIRPFLYKHSKKNKNQRNEKKHTTKNSITGIYQQRSGPPRVSVLKMKVIYMNHISIHFELGTPAYLGVCTYIYTFLAYTFLLLLLLVSYS